MSCFTQFTFPLLTYHHWYCHSLALSEYIENIDNIEDINDIEDSDDIEDIDIEDIEVIEDTDIATSLPCKRILILMILKMLILAMLKIKYCHSPALSEDIDIDDIEDIDIDDIDIEDVEDKNIVTALPCLRKSGASAEEIRRSAVEASSLSGPFKNTFY